MTVVSESAERSAETLSFRVVVDVVFTWHNIIKILCSKVVRYYSKNGFIKTASAIMIIFFIVNAYRYCDTRVSSASFVNP